MAEDASSGGTSTTKPSPPYGGGTCGGGGGATRRELVEGIASWMGMPISSTSPTRAHCSYGKGVLEVEDDHIG